MKIKKITYIFLMAISFFFIDNVYASNTEIDVTSDYTGSDLYSNMARAIYKATLDPSNWKLEDGELSLFVGNVDDDAGGVKLGDIMDNVGGTKNNRQGTLTIGCSKDGSISSCEMKNDQYNIYYLETYNLEIQSPTSKGNIYMETRITDEESFQLLQDYHKNNKLYLSIWVDKKNSAKGVVSKVLELKSFFGDKEFDDKVEIIQDDGSALKPKAINTSNSSITIKLPACSDSFWKSNDKYYFYFTENNNASFYKYSVTETKNGTTLSCNANDDANGDSCYALWSKASDTLLPQDLNGDLGFTLGSSNLYYTTKTSVCDDKVSAFNLVYQDSTCMHFQIGLEDDSENKYKKAYGSHVCYDDNKTPIEEDKSESYTPICGIFKEDGETFKIVKNIYRMLKVAVPLLVLALTISEFLRVLFSGEGKTMKDAFQATVKRFVLMVVLILLPIIVKFIINLAGLSENCMQPFMN